MIKRIRVFDKIIRALPDQNNLRSKVIYCAVYKYMSVEYIKQ